MSNSLSVLLLVYRIDMDVMYLIDLLLGVLHLYAAITLHSQGEAEKW